MINKDLIIKLILQDLKHNQLVCGLEKLGLDGAGLHSLEVLEIVSGLMKVPEPLSDGWGAIYVKCMEESVNYKITDRGEALKPLANRCFKLLMACIKTG